MNRNETRLVLMELRRLQTKAEDRFMRDRAPTALNLLTQAGILYEHEGSLAIPRIKINMKNARKLLYRAQLIGRAERFVKAKKITHNQFMRITSLLQEDRFEEIRAILAAAKRE